jgi:WD repeat-containing protein 19
MFKEHFWMVQTIFIWIQAKEGEGRFKEAITSYRLAGDMDSVVRIYLDNLSDPHSASEIVLETRSIDGARMLARFYQQIGDFESALQFLILCGCVPDAFAVAQKQNKLKHYGQLLEQSDNAKSTDYIALAQYFENEKYTLLAGKYYFLAKEFSKVTA